MEAHLISYFTAERQESLLFIVAGVIAIAVSVWLYSQRGSWRAMAYPLVAIAAIQIVVGGTVFLRTDAQVAQLTQQLREAPAEFKAQETARMRTVMANFQLYKTIEIVLLVTGLALMAVFRRDARWRAVGAGLVVQCVVMLVLDCFAEARGALYLEVVSRILLQG